MPVYFPAALNLEGRRCVVVGGGAVAARRAESLLEAGAEVRVVAPEVSPALQALAGRGAVSVFLAPYESSSLAGAFLTVAATDSPEVNAQVAADARRLGVLLNDAETPERGDFVVPSAVRRGNLLLTVTTGGASPSVAAHIASELAERYGEEYAAWLDLLGEARAAAMERLPDAATRREALRALAADETILALLREGRATEARAKAFACISSSSD